jgi:bifunctional DNA-binding transcriptional regulator/antitoxin component of YhaV-PrlF toxin-antitoxin module
MKTTIDSSGRVQLPQDLQAHLGVKPGDVVLFEERAGEWVIRSAHAESGLGWEGNVLVHWGTIVTSAKVDELIDEVRDERFRELTDGLPNRVATPLTLALP